jgi:hypothetical protein
MMSLTACLLQRSYIYVENEAFKNRNHHIYIFQIYAHAEKRVWLMHAFLFFACIDVEWGCTQQPDLLNGRVRLDQVAWVVGCGSPGLLIYIIRKWIRVQKQILIMGQINIYNGREQRGWKRCICQSYFSPNHIYANVLNATNQLHSSHPMHDY